MISLTLSNMFQVPKERLIWVEYVLQCRSNNRKRFFSQSKKKMKSKVIKTNAEAITIIESDSNPLIDLELIIRLEIRLFKKITFQIGTRL